LAIQTLAILNRKTAQQTFFAKKPIRILLKSRKTRFKMTIHGADTVLLGGKVITLDSRDTLAESLAIEDGKILHDGDSASAKIAAISLDGFGVIYQILMVALFLGAIASAKIETYFIGTSMLLLVHIVAMAFVFKRSMASLMSQRCNGLVTFKGMPNEPMNRSCAHEIHLFSGGPACDHTQHAS
jgi:hypothetical protein